jgi:hypothetical protein
MASQVCNLPACREQPAAPALSRLPLWPSGVIPGLSGWLGWGIRGQMGHETGAMVPGSMIALAAALTSPDPEIRRRAGLLGAVGAMAVSFGGTETYGQTLGLSHGDTREETYWWGLLGTAIKGGVWFGLGGTYLGMAAGDRDYSPLELLALTAVETGLWHLGVELCNRPHEPPDKLPAIYFSDRHHLDDPAREPRPEVWGGQWLALLGLLGYAGAKCDRTAIILGGAGILGGAAGFTIGQALQAWARHADLPPEWGRAIDYWKVMETTFGRVAGTALGLGLRLARAGQGPLSPRRPAPWWHNALGIAAAAVALGTHLAEQPWTDEAMDAMVIAGTGIAGAFASDTLAWLETLPLPYIYMVQNTVAYFRQEAGLPQVAEGLVRVSIPVTAGLGGLAVALARMEGSDGGPAGIGLATQGWVHTLLTHVKMLTDRHTLGLDDPEPKALPPLGVVEQVVVRSATEKCPHSSLSQLVTQAAFTVAAAGLTGLVVWAWGKTGEAGGEG